IVDKYVKTSECINSMSDKSLLILLTGYIPGKGSDFIIFVFKFLLGFFKGILVDITKNDCKTVLSKSFCKSFTNSLSATSYYCYFFLHAHFSFFCFFMALLYMKNSNKPDTLSKYSLNISLFITVLLHP